MAEQSQTQRHSDDQEGAERFYSIVERDPSELNPDGTYTPKDRPDWPYTSDEDYIEDPDSEVGRGPNDPSERP